MFLVTTARRMVMFYRTCLKYIYIYIYIYIYVGFRQNGGLSQKKIGWNINAVNWSFFLGVGNEFDE